jgi:hypothetical protein
LACTFVQVTWSAPPRITLSAQMVSHMIFPASVPAGRCKQILVRDDPAPESGPTPTDLEVSSETLANSHLSVELDERGIGPISVRGEKLFGAIGLHLRQHTFDFTLCAGYSHPAVC